MSFQTPLTINDVINDIHAKKYLLPSIQREFVWDQEQIEECDEITEVLFEENDTGKAQYIEGIEQQEN
jgi:uncharacterized protein with ParB-like and HNH nuclease domain